MTSFRKLYKSDDISLIANGIYSNDKMILDTLFKDKKEAVSVIEKLITSEYVNEYHGFFITVIYDENPRQIEGFVITYRNDQIPRNSAIKAYGDTEQISRPLIILNSLLGRFRYELTKEDYVIKNLYVLDEYRNKDHTIRLIKKSMQKARQNNAKRIVIDVEGGNDHLLDIYRSLGFKYRNEKIGGMMGKMRGYYRLRYEIR